MFWSEITQSPTSTEWGGGMGGTLDSTVGCVHSTVGELQQTWAQAACLHHEMNHEAWNQREHEHEWQNPRAF